MDSKDCLRVDRLIESTLEVSFSYHLRMIELAQLLNTIFIPLVENKNSTITNMDQSYNFDDLLVLLFEFTQILGLLNRESIGATEILNLLSFHRKRIIELVQAGKFDHLNQLIQYRDLCSDSL